MEDSLLDRLRRPLRDLRISVTDRCNFRCSYCMPQEVFGPGFAFLSHDEILTYEEIDRVVGLVLPFGVKKLRLTGGEPLLRRDVVRLVEMLRGRAPDIEITLTTNGTLLARKAAALRAAGLDRVTVSLDALDDATLNRMNSAGAAVARVVEGIETARAVGLTPVKVNTVVRRGVNQHAILDIANRFRGTGIVPRYIEYMDVGNTNGWREEEVVSAAEILATIRSEHETEPLGPTYPGEVARRHRFLDGSGEFGLIASVTMPFCGSCTRLRLSSEGRLFTCLFATEGHDLKSRLRSGATDDEISAYLAEIWTAREDRYSEIRSDRTRGEGRKEEMSRLGG